MAAPLARLLAHADPAARRAARAALAGITGGPEDPLEAFERRAEEERREEERREVPGRSPKPRMRRCARG